MRVSGLNDAVGVNFLDVLAFIPDWVYGAIAMFVVEGFVIDHVFN